MQCIFGSQKYLATKFLLLKETPPPELTYQLSKTSETTDDGDESGSGSAAGYEEDDEDDDEDDDDDFDDDLEKGAVALIERVRKISEGDEPDPFQKVRKD